MEIHSISTTTHGRVLVRRPGQGRTRGVLAGFHGYMENAAIQMDRLRRVPDESRWTLVSIQGLHRFYRPRTEDVVASWMTREDRDAAIADNLAYVAAALDAVPATPSMPVVYVGFSQGVAMAFRAAVRGPHLAAAVIAVGGDVPPELLQDPSVTFPQVLLARGERDEWYTRQRFEADVAALGSRGARVQPLAYDAAHEWTDEVVSAIDRFLSGVGTDPAGRTPSPVR